MGNIVEKYDLLKVIPEEIFLKNQVDHFPGRNRDIPSRATFFSI